MANPSVTYTFTNSTVADADEVNTNFTDIINSLTDGTKSLNIDAITAAGAATLNGAVTLGGSGSDDLTFNGSIASDIPVKTDATFSIGSSTLGLASVYLTANSNSVRIMASTAASGDYVFRFPPDVGVKGQGIQVASSTSHVYAPMQTDIYAITGSYTILDADGYRHVHASPSSDITVTLPAAANNTDRVITIAKVGTGTDKVTIGGTVNGVTNPSVDGRYHSNTVVSNGTSWLSVGPLFLSEAAASQAFSSGGAGTGATYDLYCQKRGDVVTITLDITTGTSPSASAAIASAAVPANFRPGRDIYVTEITNIASGTYYSASISTAGTITIWYHENSATTDAVLAWPASSNIQKLSVSFVDL